MKKQILLVGLSTLMLMACQQKPDKVSTLSGLDPVKFSTEVNHSQTNLYTLKNKSGMEVCITNFGGRIVSIMVPDKDGKMQDVVLGFDNIDDYIRIPSDFGASIGRYANRIAQGRFVLDNDTIQLPQNNFGHCLHGGPQGWQYQVYDANLIDNTTLELTRLSPDGDENFPGNVTAKVTFKLSDDNALDIKYSATTDKKTIINMTNHSYFNLSGDPSQPATDHILYVNADNYTPVDSTFMTTGEIIPVKDTPMDFITPKAIGQDITKYDFVQLKNGNGYDHNWVLNTNGDITKPAARLTSPKAALHWKYIPMNPAYKYTPATSWMEAYKAKKALPTISEPSVCLETQHYPDSPNKPQWPSVILEPGQTYNSECIFKFSIAK